MEYSDHYETPDLFDRLRSFAGKDLRAEFFSHTLNFIKPGRTSRGTLHERKVFYLKVWEAENPVIFGLGEAAPLAGLSMESEADCSAALRQLTADISQWEHYLFSENVLPRAVLFALEQAILDLREGGRRVLFPSKFTEGREVVLINGLVWMGEPDFQLLQINRILSEGFGSIKLKIGAAEWRDELKLIQHLREHFGVEELGIRLDANGAYSPRQALEILEDLALYDIHSIEQPIRAGQWEEMAEICRESPVPVALDEELIVCPLAEAENLLAEVLPQYLILKPSLLGGFQVSESWITHAESLGIGWWVTSSLESNVGLNALAQWTFGLQNPVPQGLGTGQVFSNNVEGWLEREGEFLQINPELKWSFPFA
jgi:o-succinylbenzoate synthase